MRRPNLTIEHILEFVIDHNWQIWFVVGFCFGRNWWIFGVLLALLVLVLEWAALRVGPELLHEET